MPSGHAVAVASGTDEVIFDVLFVDAAVIFDVVLVLVELFVIAGAAVAGAAGAAIAAGAVVATGAALIAPAFAVFFFEDLQYGATAVPFALVYPFTNVVPAGHDAAVTGAVCALTASPPANVKSAQTRIAESGFNRLLLKPVTSKQMNSDGNDPADETTGPRP